MHWRSGVVFVLAVLAAALPGGGEVSAESGVKSLSGGCSPNDITTGGGWIPPGGRDKRTFGFQAGLGRNSPFPGHLVFVNHLTKERLEGRILTYLPVTPTTREMTGKGRLNGQTATFQLQVTDATQNGSGDEFRLQIITPPRPLEAGILGGGNIVIHPICAAVTAVGPANETQWPAVSDALRAVQRVR
ncbi:MAG: hypothetical protein M3N24_07490 [Actinomycetota bacterium]|nr:hypothetical protein [Actinomycetota bacterium]